MPESTPLYPEMKVSDYLDYRGRLFGLPRSRRRAAIASVTDWCSLESVSTRRIGALSKGFKQRVGLAAALLHDPPVLVLEEPTNGLDPTQIHEVRGLVKRLSERRTMLISSHILSEVERLCDRIIIMSAGVVRADGTPSQLGALMSDGRVYQIEAKAISADKLKTLTSMLAAVAGVDSVQEQAAADDGWYSFVVRSKAGAPDLREALAGASQRAGASIRELHAVMPTLERVFRTLTENDTLTKAEPKITLKDGEA
jgi:ABC-2 type transport system ATP-binding protein